MITERRVKALRQEIAQRLFELEAAAGEPAGDEGDDLPGERAERRDRLRMAVDVLTEVLGGT